jgi:hypothetical protein
LQIFKMVKIRKRNMKEKKLSFARFFLND